MVSINPNSGNNNISPKQFNSWQDIGYKGKLLIRDVDGSPELIIKCNNEYFEYTDDNRLVQIQENPGDTMFTKKTFSRIGTPVTAQDQSENLGPVFANIESNEEDKARALSDIGNSYSAAVESFKEKNGNPDPIDITKMTPSDIQNLENGTPVFVLRQKEDGSWSKRSGIIFNGTIVREHTAFSRLGFENNYKSLGVYDPNAFSEGNDSLIGKVALFNDGSAEYKVES